MLLYLAEKSRQFVPTDVRGRADVLQWLFWQVGGLGPMSGQNGHFSVYAPTELPYAIERYTKEVHRLYSVMNTRLADRDGLEHRQRRAAARGFVIEHGWNPVVRRNLQELGPVLLALADVHR